MISELQHVKNVATAGYAFPYAITIKPDPKRPFDVYNLSVYLRDRNYRFWLAEVQSQKGFRHMHGVLTFPKKESYSQIRNTLRRYINANIGMCRLNFVENFDKWYAYIKAHEVVIHEYFSQNQL